MTRTNYLRSTHAVIEKPENPVNICLFKVNDKNSRKRSEICSKLTIKTPERCQNDVSGVVLIFLLLTLNMFHTSFQCFFCWLRTSKCFLGTLLGDLCNICWGLQSGVKKNHHFALYWVMERLCALWSCTNNRTPQHH